MKYEYMAIAQARLTSKRFPRKIFTQIGDKMLIDHVNEYCYKNFHKNYIFAIPDTNANNELSEYLNRLQILTLRGSELNVLKRFRDVINKYQPKYFIRITSDNPFKCSEIIDKMMNEFSSKRMKILTNSVNKTFPLGLEVEIIDSEFFLSNTFSIKDQGYIEHVTLGLYELFAKETKHFMSTVDNSDIRLTIDFKSDLGIINKIYSEITDEVNYPSILNAYNNIYKSNRKIGHYHIQ